MKTRRVLRDLDDKNSFENSMNSNLFLYVLTFEISEAKTFYYNLKRSK